MKAIMRIAAALVVIPAFTSAAPASDTRPRHTVKHAHHLRIHHHPPGVIHGQPAYLGPTEYPGHRYGGPLYSTCDRINADRMLVGTCR